jgi:transcriptional regulator with GAF, ATPase, and Fis domain
MQRKRSIRTITAPNPLSNGPRRPPTRMLIVHPPEIAGPIELVEGIVAFGRGQTGSLGAVFVELPDDTVSRNHFVLAWVAAQSTWVIKDLGSRNGTWVDGVKVSEEFIPLGDNAVVRAGYVVLVLDMGEEPSADDAAAVSTAAIPGQSIASRALRAAVGRAARDPSPALVFGETGVGKELIAAEIHRLSGRGGPLVAINCAALSRELVESQLFGHERGAFTGAHDTQAGYFRAAQGGTLFLDEIGELPLDLQPKLLRAIEVGMIQPVGSTRTVRVDVRVVAATNRELGRLVDEGGFRRDLYARISLWEIAVPPLAKRRADIALWIGIFHARWLSARGLSAGPLRFDALAMELLLRSRWRENLRGLDRVVHELASRPAQEGPFTPSDLPAWLYEARPAPSVKSPAPKEPSSAREPSAREADAASPDVAGKPEASAQEPPSRERETETTAPMPELRDRLPAPSREELLSVLKQLGGSVRATAKHFDRDRRQIYRWIRSYGIRDDDL